MPEATRCDLDLLKYGRHFRPPGGAKAVVGRIKRENEAIETLISSGDFLLKVEHYPVRWSWGAGLHPKGTWPAAAGLAAAYSDAPEGAPVTVTAEPGGSDRVFRLTTPIKDRFKPWLV